MKPVTISVIVAVRNGARTLQRCIDSVHNQEYPHKELIVVDGKSTDETVNILSRNDSAIAWWTSEADSGIYEAWNKALAHARGDWICFLGADDYFAKNTSLGEMLPYLASAFPPHRLVYGKVVLVDRNSQVIEISGGPWNKARFLTAGMLFYHQGVFHHRTLFEAKGQFDQQFKIAADYEMMLREAVMRDPVYAEDVTVSVMEVGGLSANDLNSTRILCEYMRAQRMHRTTLIPWRLLWPFTKGLIKIWLIKCGGEKFAHKLIDRYRLLSGRRRRFDA